MQRTDYVFKVANRSKTESQNSKQNRKTQNRNTKLKTESQKPKQNHKTQNRITKLKAESKNSKQNRKTQNRITKLKTESQNAKQNRPRSSIENDTRFQTKTANKCISFGAAHTYMAYIREFPPGTFTVEEL